MGVWIETLLKVESGDEGTSHPVWVCGLKLYKGKTVIIVTTSHPVWVCGLKQEKSEKKRNFLPSHPVWVCGLKLSLCY